MSTFKIIEVFKISNSTILVCDLFDDSAITDTLITDVGTFYKGEFEVERPTACFSKLKQRFIAIRKTGLPIIHEIRFG